MAKLFEIKARGRGGVREELGTEICRSRPCESRCARAAHAALMRDMKWALGGRPNTQEVAMNKDLWLPFLNTYRTRCLAPEPPFRRVLEEIRAWA